MDMPVYRLIDLARLLFFRALLLEAERRRDVSPSTSAHDTLQTARTHRRRAARRGRGVRPTGTPLSARGVDSRQRAVDLRPMPDLCGQRARRGRLFAFDANGELIEAPTPAGDVPSSRRTARPSRRATDFSRGTAAFSRGAVPCAERPMPSTAENVDASMRAVPCAERPVPSAFLDPLFPERPMPSAAGDGPSAAWDVHAAVRDVLAPAEDVSSLERAARSSRRAVRSAKRSVPSAKRSAPSLEEIVPSDLLDSPFPERPMPKAAGDVHSVKRSAPPLEEIVSLDLLDSPFPKRGVQSPKRSVPSKTGTLHTRTADGVVAGEARYAALAKRSAQTADRLLRRVSRHRAKGR